MANYMWNGQARGVLLDYCNLLKDFKIPVELQQNLLETAQRALSTLKSHELGRVSEFFSSSNTSPYKSSGSFEIDRRFSTGFSNLLKPQQSCVQRSKF